MIEELLDKWSSQRPSYKAFCRDGILVNTEYEKSEPKILFLLKETYDSFINIKGPMGPMGTSNTFWRKMKMWSYITEQSYNNNIPHFEKALKIKEDPNTGVAYVNLKKNAEKKEYNREANSNEKDILKYVEQDKDFLKKQIAIINPDIIFCCGTFRFLKYVYDSIRKLSPNIYTNQEAIIIDYRHPANRKSYINEFETLSSITSNLYNNKLNN